MKNIISILLLVFLYLAGFCQESFTIKGKFTDIKEGKIVLQYRSRSESITDSVFLKDGNFEIKGSVNGPQRVTMSLRPVSGPGDQRPGMGDQQVLYLEPGLVKVNGKNTLRDAEITGGKSQADYLALQAQLKPLQDKMSPLGEKMRQYFQENNKAAQDELFPRLRAIRLEMNNVEEAFALQHGDSYVSVDIIRARSTVIDPAKFEPFLNALSARLRNTEEVKAMEKRFSIAKRVDIGQPAINFTQNNLEGIPVTLAAYKGKYILLDFWASWCGPCRAENPNVLKAYKKFKDKNFDVLAVSLDEKKEAWVKAINDDGMPWIHVSDLLGWKNAPAQEYGVAAIPQNFLIDPAGKIIAKNLRGEDLDKKLEELVK